MFIPYHPRVTSAEVKQTIYSPSLYEEKKHVIELYSVLIIFNIMLANKLCESVVRFANDVVLVDLQKKQMEEKKMRELERRKSVVSNLGFGSATTCRESEYLSTRWQHLLLAVRQVTAIQSYLLKAPIMFKCTFYWLSKI